MTYEDAVEICRPAVPAQPARPAHNPTPQQLENRQRLIEALRAPMPKRFKWDFTLPYSGDEPCGAVGCALGLMRTIGITNSTNVYDAADAIGLPLATTRNVFWPVSAGENEDIAEGHGVLYRSVTPAMVADKLEHLFATGGAPDALDRGSAA